MEYILGRGLQTMEVGSYLHVLPVQKKWFSARSALSSEMVVSNSQQCLWRLAVYNV